MCLSQVWWSASQQASLWSDLEAEDPVLLRLEKGERVYLRDGSYIEQPRLFEEAPS